MNENKLDLNNYTPGSILLVEYDYEEVFYEETLLILDEEIEYKDGNGSAIAVTINDGTVWGKFYSVKLLNIIIKKGGLK